MAALAHQDTPNQVVAFRGVFVLPEMIQEIPSVLDEMLRLLAPRVRERPGVRCHVETRIDDINLRGSDRARVEAEFRNFMSRSVREGALMDLFPRDTVFDIAFEREIHTMTTRVILSGRCAQTVVRAASYRPDELNGPAPALSYQGPVTGRISSSRVAPTSPNSDNYTFTVEGITVTVRRDMLKSRADAEQAVRNISEMIFDVSRKLGHAQPAAPIFAKKRRLVIKRKEK